MPSDYSKVEYWDERFRKNPNAFDWLQNPDQLLPCLHQFVDNFAKPKRRILHIGSGSSALSLKLRELVDQPGQVHNIDYSIEAVALGQSVEQEYIHSNNLYHGGRGSNCMKWSQADLLQPEDIGRLLDCKEYYCTYNIIIDKSTSDAISCGIDIELDKSVYELPMAAHLHVASKVEPVNVSKGAFHPLHILSLHMAILSIPGAYWLIFSYSDSRFPWWDEFEMHIFRGDIAHLHPNEFWTLESKITLDSKAENSNANPHGFTVHMPPNAHYLYVLRRTEQVLHLKTTRN